MKTEYKKVSELLALQDAEVLKEFEMVELQGGKDIWACDNASGDNCPVYNFSICASDCFCPGKACQHPL